MTRILKAMLLGMVISTLPLQTSITIAQEQGTIVLAQSNDAAYRLNVLEEQIRQLNGKIEDLNFQLLETQERMRRQQEDNEFRFQEIEEKLGMNSGAVAGGGSNETASVGTGDSLEKPEPSGQNEGTTSLGGNDTTSANSRETLIIDGVEIFQGDSGIDKNNSGTLGTIQFDENGNIVDTAIGKPLDLTSRLNADGNQAPAELAGDPKALFDLGYGYVQTGRYQDAEGIFSQFSNRYPDDERISEARFWLGESHLGRGQFKQAAEVYLDAHKKWPDGRFAPQTLLKLGVSMAGLNQRELACATYAQVIEKYPDASRAVQRNVALEQRAANCLAN